jgi:hypothetical protein
MEESGLEIPSGKSIVGHRDTPLILASVSRSWCDIAANFPPLWSTIIVDQSEQDHLERVYLFLDRSNKEPLEIILLDHESRITRGLLDIITGHADRFKTLVSLSAPSDDDFRSSQTQSIIAPTKLVHWSEFKSRRRAIPVTQIPTCIPHVLLHPPSCFAFNALIQFTSFHNLESLCLYITLGRQDHMWDKKLQFNQLRQLRLHAIHKSPPNPPPANNLSNLEPPWLECLECPTLADLCLDYALEKGELNRTYPRLEAGLLCFKSLRNLYINVILNGRNIRAIDAVEIQNMQSSIFGGRLESVRLTFNRFPYDPSEEHEVPESVGGTITERLFSVFVPNTHLAWEYAQFPSPIMFHNLKILHIIGYIVRNESALVAPETTQILDFPLLTELYIQSQGTRWPDRLQVPRLELLHIRDALFLPSLYTQRSSNAPPIVPPRNSGGRLQDPYLPSAAKVQLDLSLPNLYQLNLHPLRTQDVTINIPCGSNLLISCPLNWTMGDVTEQLGTVIELNMKSSGRHIFYCFFTDFRPSPDTISTFLNPFKHLKRLTLPFATMDRPTHVDHFARHLVDPHFLPELEALSISEYPSWSHFFQYIQQRQIGFLCGQFPTGLKEITTKGRVHAALLEHLGESLAGKCVNLINMPPQNKGPKEWPIQPFKYEGFDTEGLLSCYACHKGGLEIGCTVSPSKRLDDMLVCSRHPIHIEDWESNKVFVP